MASARCFIKEDENHQVLYGFDETLKTIRESINKLKTEGRANIAIVSEPFSGKTGLLSKIARIRPEDTSKIYLEGLVTDRTLFQTLEKSGEIVFVDNCHFLYSRKIGGFWMLDEFLNFMATSDKLFITTWNKYSWNFLSELYPLTQIFPLKIEPPKLNMQDLKKMIMSSCEWELIFEEEQVSPEEKILEITRVPFEVKPLKRTFSVPVPVLDYAAIRSKLPDRFKASRKKESISVEDKVFNRLLDYSAGNPGVAKAIWKMSVEQNEGSIKPADIAKPQHKFDLNYNESFALYILLTMKSIRKNDLQEIAGPDTNVSRLLNNLYNSKLITLRDGDVCEIRPEALFSIENYLKSMRLVF